MKVLVALMLLVTPAMAQEPTEEQKAAAIRGMYGIPHMVKTERIILDPKPEEPAEVDWDARRKFMNRTFRVARHELDNVCTRHNMRKVTTRGGKAWRCQK